MQTLSKEKVAVSLHNQLVAFHEQSGSLAAPPLPWQPTAIFGEF
jgi:hypothetical protein